MTCLNCGSRKKPSNHRILHKLIICKFMLNSDTKKSCERMKLLIFERTLKELGEQLQCDLMSDAQDFKHQKRQNHATFKGNRILPWIHAFI